MRRRDVGRGRRLRPGFTPNSGLGGLEAGSEFLRKRRSRPRSDRPVLRRGRSSRELGAELGRADGSDLRSAASLRRQDAIGRPKDAGSAEGLERPKNAERSGAIRTRGAEADP